MIPSTLASALLALSLASRPPLPGPLQAVVEGLRGGPLAREFPRALAELEVQLGAARAPERPHANEALEASFDSTWAALEADLDHQDQALTPAERIRELQTLCRLQPQLWNLEADLPELVGILSATRSVARSARLEHPALVEAIARVHARQTEQFEALDLEYQALRQRILVLPEGAPPTRRGRLLEESRDLARRVDDAVQAFARATWAELTPPGRVEACRLAAGLLGRLRWVASCFPER